MTDADELQADQAGSPASVLGYVNAVAALLFLIWLVRARRAAADGSP